MTKFDVVSSKGETVIEIFLELSRDTSNERENRKKKKSTVYLTTALTRKRYLFDIYIRIYVCTYAHIRLPDGFEISRRVR